MAEQLKNQDETVFRRHRGKFGLLAGIIAGFAGGSMIPREKPQENPAVIISPQVRAELAGVLVCRDEGCLLLPPEIMQEFGEGCEEGFLPPPTLPPECFEQIPQGDPMVMGEGYEL